jgi:hypothetical protein
MSELVLIITAITAAVSGLVACLQTIVMEYLRRKYPTIHPPPITESEIKDVKNHRRNRALAATQRNDRNPR